MGFNNFTHVEYQVISLDDLDKKFKANDTVDFAALKKARLANNNLPVKLLANGELTKALTIKVNAASATAIKAVEKANGKVEIVNN